MDITPNISIIAAIDSKGGIGKNNKLLWYIPQDLARFKKLTQNHPVIMGRKTYESLPVKPLPKRTNIIITSNHQFNAPDCTVCTSIEEALEKAKEIDNQEIFIIGGAQIYAQSIKFATKLYLTLVDGDFQADTFFPEYSQFTKIISEQKNRSEGLSYTFIELTR
jgi:dihydrofolate reductase